MQADHSDLVVTAERHKRVVAVGAEADAVGCSSHLEGAQDIEPGGQLLRRRVPRSGGGSAEDKQSCECGGTPQ